jgi:hypothetical protein
MDIGDARTANRTGASFGQEARRHTAWLLR